MSHITKQKMELKNVKDDDILAMAIDFMVEHFGYERVEKYGDYVGKNQKKSKHVLKHPTYMRYGFSVEVEKGEVNLVGDFWGQNRLVVQQQLTQSYIGAGYDKALRMKGYMQRKWTTKKNKNNQQVLTLDAMHF